MLPTLHSTNRLFEWASAAIMLQVGGGLLLAVSFDIRVAGVFPVLTGWGLSVFQIGAVFLAFGVSGCVALYANGRWKRYGCYLRAARCGLGVCVWFQMFYGVVLVLIEKREMLLVLFVWGTLAGAEFISLRRAFQDCQAYRWWDRVSENATGTS